MTAINTRFKVDKDTTACPHIESCVTSKYPHREKRKVFFIASTGLCNLGCPYCVTGSPRLPYHLDKGDFSYIFEWFGENIYFIFSGLGDFFCGYPEKEQLLRFILERDVRVLLDINGIEIKELADNSLGGKEKIDMIDISCHFGTMKKQGLLKKWAGSVRKIHDNGYDYHIKMVLSPLERDMWEEGISFYRQEVFPFTGKKLIVSPDYLSDVKGQLNELQAVSAEHRDTVENLSQYGLFKTANFPDGKTPPCPAGSRYFRVLYSGDIMPCEYLGNNLNVRLGNVKQRNAAILKDDVLCNYGGFCDCGWTSLPRFGLFNDRNQPYQRRFFHQFESSPRTCFTSLPQETNNITCHFNKLGYDIPLLKNIIVEGRAYINGADNIKNEYYIILKSWDRCHIFNSFASTDSDINACVDSGKADDLAFFAFIPYDAVEPGKYKVGIYIKNSATEALQYTNEIVLKD